MKTRLVIILTGLVVVLGFIAGCSSAPEDETAINKGTSFQDHSEGKYGPEGAGGYGSPVAVEPDDDASAERKAVMQDVREGTAFQDHSEGKYGPIGAGGYGSPVPVPGDEDAASGKKALMQNVREGTSFQDHSEGKYGPEGAGGYGPPATK